jgi:hypothetical protein
MLIYYIEKQVFRTCLDVTLKVEYFLSKIEKMNLSTGWQIRISVEKRLGLYLVFNCTFIYKKENEDFVRKSGLIRRDFYFSASEFGLGKIMIFRRGQDCDGEIINHPDTHKNVFTGLRLIYGKDKERWDPVLPRKIFASEFNEGDTMLFPLKKDDTPELFVKRDFQC